MSDPGTQAPAPSAELRRFHAVARVVFKGAIALVGLNAVFGLLVVAGHVLGAWLMSWPLCIGATRKGWVYEANKKAMAAGRAATSTRRAERLGFGAGR